jgi:DNA invertase Pin-like site-specific DNA recombinase
MCKKVGYIRVSTEKQNPERQLPDIDLDITFNPNCV